MPWNFYSLSTGAAQLLSHKIMIFQSLPETGLTEFFPTEISRKLVEYFHSLFGEYFYLVQCKELDLQTNIFWKSLWPTLEIQLQNNTLYDELKKTVYSNALTLAADLLQKAIDVRSTFLENHRIFQRQSFKELFKMT